MSICIKASAVIYRTHDETLLQHKLWNCLIAHAYVELLTTDVHTICVGTMAQSVGYNSHNIDHVKEALLGLAQIRAVMIKNKKNIITEPLFLCTSISIQQGICSYSFCPNMKKLLYRPKMYTNIKLDIHKKFK